LLVNSCYSLVLPPSSRLTTAGGLDHENCGSSSLSCCMLTTLNLSLANANWNYSLEEVIEPFRQSSQFTKKMKTRTIFLSLGQKWFPFSLVEQFIFVIIWSCEKCFSQDMFLYYCDWPDDFLRHIVYLAHFWPRGFRALETKRKSL